MTTDNFSFYLQNRLIQTSQTGGQQNSDTSPFSIPCLYYKIIITNISALTFALASVTNYDHKWRHNLEYNCDHHLLL